MTPKQAEKIIETKLPHSAECQRHTVGTWDKSGNCERCSAWLVFNEARFPKEKL